MVGQYNIMIENPSPDILLQVSCTVNSFPRDESYPVKMNTHAVDRDTGEITIFAEVSQGLYPVLHATLYAQERFRNLNFDYKLKKLKSTKVNSSRIE